MIDDDAQLDVLLGEPKLPLRDSGDVEQIVDEADHDADLPIDDVAGLLDDRVVRLHLPEDVESVEDGRQRAAQLMRKQGHELLLAPVGLDEPLGPFPLVLQRLAFGEIVHHPDEGTRLLVFVEEGRDDGLAPEPGAVPPNLPATAVGPAFHGSSVDFAFRATRQYVFGREESREVLADDFVGLVAEDAFRAGIPAQNLPPRADQEDGVFLRVRGQRVESLFHLSRRESF
jgi:hypothetical protein